jgi:predicted nucleic acid-binding protein
VVNRAVAKLMAQNEALCIAPQNLVEFWAVATRPLDAKPPGLGMDLRDALKELSSLRSLFRVLPYTPQVLSAWERIIVAQGVSGRQTHDAHLVAMMQVHSVASILTFNDRDFRRYPGMSVLHPAQI